RQISITTARTADVHIADVTQSAEIDRKPLATLLQPPRILQSAIDRRANLLRPLGTGLTEHLPQHQAGNGMIISSRMAGPAPGTIDRIVGRRIREQAVVALT